MKPIFSQVLASNEGVPPEVLSRGVRIYRPAKTAMQSGTAGTEEWKIDFDVQGRWENELMGWSSRSEILTIVVILCKH
jgi:NADH dehydrogenase (ubiquinone) Fe-S protein 4